MCSTTGRPLGRRHQMQSIPERRSVWRRPPAALSRLITTSTLSAAIVPQPTFRRAVLARSSHPSIRTLPGTFDFALDFRPDYFAQFDALLQRLRDAVPDIALRAELLAALQLEGRDLDAEQLTGELQLGQDVGDVVEQLAAFGDQGHWVHSFASVHIAQIAAGSDGMCSVTTYVLATRQAGSIEYWWQDENGGRGDLGMRDHPLSLIEAIVLVDAVLLAQASYDVVGADWRSGYLVDETMHVTVRSAFYEGLQSWYEATIANWRTARGEG